ncbi:MAG: hypothetical protein AAGA75_26820 [Cyanobacteria bacterium P01_E01_bin.6]
MGFPSAKSKTSSTATATNKSGEAPAKTIDCDLLITKLQAMLSGYCTETTDLPADVQLMTGDLADLIEGIKIVAQAMSIDYDSSKDSTYKFIVTEKGSAYLAGPSLVLHEENQVALAWGDKVYPIDGNESITDPQRWRVLPVEGRMIAVFGGATIKFPVSLRLNDAARAKKGNSTVIETEYVSMFNFGQLATYLKPLGAGAQKFSELEDGSAVVITGIKEIRDTKDGTRQYAILDTDAGDFFAPGEVKDWQDSDLYPLTVTKQGNTIVAVINNEEYSISLSKTYTKIADLEIGAEYKVAGYSVDTASYDGRSWDSPLLYVHDSEGAELIVNGNKQVLEALTTQLGASNDEGVRHECDATLTLDSVKIGKNEKRYPRFRFQIKTKEFGRLATLLSNSKKSA